MPSLDARRLTLNAKRGFTLIELLIVISIIGILAAIILASYGGVQAKARDGRRKSDLAQLKRAMELAKSDCKSSAYYPYFTGGLTAHEDYNALISYLSNSYLKYISSSIQDPNNIAPQVYSFAGESGGPLTVCPKADDTGIPGVPGTTNYAIWVKLERNSDVDSFDSRNACKDKPTPPTSGAPWPSSDYAGYYVMCNN